MKEIIFTRDKYLIILIPQANVKNDFDALLLEGEIASLMKNNFILKKINIFEDNDYKILFFVLPEAITEENKEKILKTYKKIINDEEKKKILIEQLKENYILKSLLEKLKVNNKPFVKVL